MSISRGKYIVLGEVNIVCTALRRDLQKANRWDSHDQQVSLTSHTRVTYLY